MGDIQEGIPARIRTLRLERNLSQLELANRVGVAQTAISQFETGVKTPRLETLGRIAAALGISPAVLIAEEEDVAHES